LPIAPYVGAAYGTYEHRWLPVGGLNVFFTRHLSALATYNGVNSHLLMNYSFNRHAFSLVMVRWRQPGISYSISF
jgi:hypothetical protein